MDELQRGLMRAAESYLAGHSIVKALGTGVDGVVFSTSRNTAVKAHRRRKGFVNELDVYQRLLECDATDVAGHALPRLRGWDEPLLVIEISIVRPPYVLDFANSTLDWPPDFPQEAWDEWYRLREEEFGDNWPAALNIFNELQRRWGVFHMDFSPRNIAFVAIG
jgi:hypothetical protein